MNSYDQSRQEAWDRMLRQLEMRQRYVDRTQADEDLAMRKEMDAQKMAEPGSREVDWAGKGLAAGGLWGALAGATAGRTANAFEAGSHGSAGHRVGGVLSAFFSPRDLINAGKNKMTDQKESALASGMGREFGRNSTSGMKEMDSLRAKNDTSFNGTGSVYQEGGTANSDFANVKLGSLQNPGEGSAYDENAIANAEGDNSNYLNKPRRY